ncbi:MAG: PepSY domain-containing protein [Gammaproteobacteria bacterium]|nr:PepSY domain-containing protein [Gammaproteobacteria bacterium]
MIKNIIILLFITASGITTASDDHDEAKRLLDSGDILPLETILIQIRSSHPGKILEVEFETEHSQKIYEIELLSADGKVNELKIDATNGNIISTEKEH